MSSFHPVPVPASLAEAIRQTFTDDVGADRLGVGAHRRGGDIYFAFPIVVIAGRTKSAS
jgi:hypothetical protein